jgi:hypothetical protein
MAKISYSPIVNATNLIPAVNARFEKLVNDIDSYVLFRRSPQGEPNSMAQDLDLANNDLLNAGALKVGDNPLYTIVEDAVYQQIEDPVLVAAVEQLETDVGILKTPRYLSALYTDRVAISDVGQVVVADTVLAGENITLNPDGSVTYPLAGCYSVTWSIKVNVTSPTTIYTWLESYNGSSWDLLPNTGFARDFGNTGEVEIRQAYLRPNVTPGTTIRIMIARASSGAATFASATLPNGVVMPSFRLDIHCL